MDITNVTNDDGRALANLINFLKAGRWDLGGNDAEVLVSVKHWVHGLAGKAAQQLKTSAVPSNSPSPPASSSGQSGGFKIKAMGSLPATGKSPMKLGKKGKKK